MGPPIVSSPRRIEQNFPHDILVILDSDTLFLREPAEFVLPPGVDAAVRPVDVKGISTQAPMTPSTLIGVCFAVVVTWTMRVFLGKNLL